MLRRIVIVVAILLICIGIYYFYPRLKGSIQVEVFTVKKGNLISTVTSSSIATVVSEREVDISSELTGRIEKVLVREGEKVIRGQKLVQLNDKRLRLVVEEKRIREKKLKNEFERYQNLFDKEFISEIELIEKKFNYQIALNDFQKAMDNLDKTEIFSPTNGIVSEVRFESGDLVRVGAYADQSILTLIDPNRLQISMGVDETDIERVRIGQDAEIVFEALPGKILKGKVKRIAEAVTNNDLIGQTYEVIIKLLDREDWIRPGMTADVNIVVAKKNNVLRIPLEAVIEKRGEHFVYVLKDENALLTRISQGFNNMEFVEINSGISEGEKIIISNLEKVKNGDRVRLKKAN